MYQFGFCDLSVNVNGVDKACVTSVCKRLRINGFRTVALNVTLEEDIFKTSKKKKGKKRDESSTEIVPEPVIDNIEGLEDLKVLTRLTVHISDPSQLYQLKRSVNFFKYNLFAVVPLNQNIFQQVCAMNDVDIISFTPENKPPFRVTRKLYNIALDKNIFFEIPYGPAILDSTCRKNVISAAHQYFTVGNSKNVVITSSSCYPYNTVRGPYDIVHLGLVFGLNDVATKKTITKNCTLLIMRAEARQKKKSFILSADYIKVPILPERSPIEERPLKKVKYNEEVLMEIGTS